MTLPLEILEIIFLYAPVEIKSLSRQCYAFSSRVKCSHQVPLRLADKVVDIDIGNRELDLSIFKNLESLTLTSKNKIPSTLKRLNLSYNDKITNIHCPDIEFLDLSYNDAIANNQLLSLKKLKHLILDGNDNITTFSYIEKLSIRNNIRITKYHCKNLTSLNIEHNKIFTDECMEYLSGLTDLILDQNERITDAGIAHMVNLRSLSLKGNKLITNNGVDSLYNLKRLNIVNNHMITSTGIRNLKLTHLYINKHNRVRVSRDIIVIVI